MPYSYGAIEEINFLNKRIESLARQNAYSENKYLDTYAKLEDSMKKCEEKDAEIIELKNKVHYLEGKVAAYLDLLQKEAQK